MTIPKCVYHCPPPSPRGDHCSSLWVDLVQFSLYLGHIHLYHQARCHLVVLLCDLYKHDSLAMNLFCFLILSSQRYFWLCPCRCGCTCGLFILLMEGISPCECIHPLSVDMSSLYFFLGFFFFFLVFCLWCYYKQGCCEHSCWSLLMNLQSTSSGAYSRRGLADLWGMYLSNLTRQCHNVFKNDCGCLHHQQQCVRVSFTLHLDPNLSGFYIFCQNSRCKMVTLCS